MIRAWSSLPVLIVDEIGGVPDSVMGSEISPIMKTEISRSITENSVRNRGENIHEQFPLIND